MGVGLDGTRPCICVLAGAVEQHLPWNVLHAFANHGPDIALVLFLHLFRASAKPSARSESANTKKSRELSNTHTMSDMKSYLHAPRQRYSPTRHLKHTHAK